MKTAHLMGQWTITLEVMQHICAVVASYTGEDSQISLTDGKRLRIEHFLDSEQEIQESLDALRQDLLFQTEVLSVDYDEA